MSKFINDLKSEWTNRTLKENLLIILLSILGACSVLIDVVTPLFLVFMWVKIFGFYGFSSLLLYVIGLLATLFRIIRKWTD